MHVRSESESLEDTWNDMYFNGDSSDAVELYDRVLDVIALSDQVIESLQERVRQLENQLEAAATVDHIRSKSERKK